MDIKKIMKTLRKKPTCIHNHLLREDCVECHWDNGCNYGKASGHGEGDHIEDCDCGE